MKRSKVEWSDAVDVIEGPCAVCGKDVRFLVPDDRQDPKLLYHSTCDMMPLIREQLKTAHPPLMPAQHVIVKPPKPAAAAPAAATASVIPPVSETPKPASTPPPAVPPVAS